MSDYGLELKSAFGTMSLDSEHAVYQYAEKGTVTLTTYGTEWPDYPGWVMVDFADPCAGPPIVTRRLRGGSCILKSEIAIAYNVGGEATGFITSIGWQGGDPPSYPIYIDWMLFKPISDSDKVSGDYGLNLYNSSGDFIWSSNVTDPPVVRAVYESGKYPMGTTRHFVDPTYPTTDRYFIRVLCADCDGERGAVPVFEVAV
jgi:hypothetical protein